METTQVATTSFDHQVAKNKRKKFNPKFMLTNSSSDDEGGGSMEKDIDENQSSDECHEGAMSAAKNEIISEIPNTNFAITKSQQNNNNNNSPPPSNSHHAIANPFMSPANKLSFLQTFGSLQQQQQQLFQQAAISAIAPQLTQQMNLSETEAKFREFAFKTMQELLNIYGLSLSTNDIVDALKQQHMGKCMTLLLLLLFFFFI
jgi:hypothetical protein